MNDSTTATAAYPQLPAILKRIILVVLGALLLFLAHWSKEMTALAEPTHLGADEFSVLPNKAALKWMSLGHEETLADLIWIRALQYNNLKNEAQLAESFADAIIELDPDFEPVYRWVAVKAVFSDNISAAAVQRAIDYLTLGAERFPEKSYYHYNIATNYMSYYPSENAEEDAELRKKAIYHLQQAMQKPDAEPMISMLISGLLNRDESSAKIKFLQQAVLTENDPQTKRYLQTRLVLLSDNQSAPLLMLNAKRDQWQQEHHPYLPIMLDYLVSYDDVSF